MAGAGSQHRLHEKCSRVVAVQGKYLASDNQHVGHASHVAKRRGIFGQQRHIIGINLQRALEPGDSGPQTELESQQLAAILQCANIAGVQPDGFINRIGCAGLVSRIGAKACDGDP